MRTDKTYVFKPRWWMFDLIFILIMVVIPVAMIISAWHAPLAILLICPIPAYLIYLQQYVIRVTRQYNQADTGKTIIISEDRNQLTFIQHNEKVVIKSDDVRKAVLYDQPDLGKFGRYTYLIICTADRQFLITNFTIPLQGTDPILSRFLSKKPRETFTTKFNFIRPEYLWG